VVDMPYYTEPIPELKDVDLGDVGKSWTT
jgi:hypothetical protein